MESTIKLSIFSMKGDILKYLKSQFSQAPRKIDRLIVSAFLNVNGIAVKKNRFIKEYIIDKYASDEELNTLGNFLSIFKIHKAKFDFELLIELFEFVVSPSDKVVNGAIYTPEYIRKYIVRNALQQYNGDLNTLKAADISCGCGGFLMSLVEALRDETGRTCGIIYKEQIYGIDIADYSIVRTKILLCLYAICNGEDCREFEFNLYTGNSLTFDWRCTCSEISQNNGFDIIVGNPPYVCSRNMDSETLELLKKFEVASTGHPDLYIPFFQIGINNLNPGGILGYITVNTFTKSVNGRALRKYFAENDVNLTILNFGGEQIFQDRNTYTCICFIKAKEGKVNYARVRSNDIDNIDLNRLHEFEYSLLDNYEGWNLVSSEEMYRYVRIVENVGVPFKELYKTKTGIATLKNEVYKFVPVKQDSLYYYLEDNGSIFPIEKGICRDIVNANKIKVVEDIDRFREKIIFPYNKRTEILQESIMRESFRCAYRYLKSKRDVLATRDKGAGNYEVWYAYGRKQSMDIDSYKLFFPHICERPNFVICEDRQLLFYNGRAIISNDKEELLVIKKVMESDLFYQYIKNTTKYYSSDFLSLAGNYIKNFGIYQFSDEQRAFLLRTENLDSFLEELYGVGDFAEMAF